MRLTPRVGSKAVKCGSLKSFSRRGSPVRIRSDPLTVFWAVNIVWLLCPAHNRVVAGSNPAWPIQNSIIICHYSTTAVRLTCNQEVWSSNLHSGFKHTYRSG